MRLILAIKHVEMQRFIAQNYQIELAGIAESLEELHELLAYVKADTLLISRYMCNGSVIEGIKNLRQDLRIIYLYGERDAEADNCIRLFDSIGITDCYVGASLNSEDLDRLLFGSTFIRREGMFKNLIKRPNPTICIKELVSAVITIYSNSSNGKSHLAWNLATEISSRGYKTTLINVDRGNSANIYFGIPDIYNDLLDYILAEDNHRGILDNCFKRGILNVIAGTLGSETSIETKDFLKLLYYARSKSDVVIIDTWTGLNELTLQAINNSNYDFLIFDSDLMHFHLNTQMIEQLGSCFIAEKTYSVINNCNPLSESYKYIYKQINKLNLGFRDILPLSSCGSLGCDLMHTGRTPYNTPSNLNGNFKNDLDNILKGLNARTTRKGLNIKK